MQALLSDIEVKVQSLFLMDIDEMLFLHPSWNTVEGVYELCESRGEKTPRRNESKHGWTGVSLAQPGDQVSIW